MFKVNHGTLLDSFTPPVNPPAEIEDPEDSMPADWVRFYAFMLIQVEEFYVSQSDTFYVFVQDEREKIPDPEASKPEDWDESAPQKILDESAEKPSGWLDDEPDMIADPDAVRPEDWDDEMDGEETNNFLVQVVSKKVDNKIVRAFLAVLDNLNGSKWSKNLVFHHPL